MHCLSVTAVRHRPRCRPAHDGGAAGALGEAHGGGRCQPVHIPPGGYAKPRQPHQGDQRERHEGEDEAAVPTDWTISRVTGVTGSRSLIDERCLCCVLRLPPPGWSRHQTRHHCGAAAAVGEPDWHGSGDDGGAWFRWAEVYGGHDAKGKRVRRWKWLERLTYVM